MIGFRRDPLEDVEALVPRVYAYVAYRLGDGADAEDVTSECFERALRYRRTYSARKGEPLAWLIGIARRLVAEHVRRRELELVDSDLEVAGEDHSEEAVRRLGVRRAVAQLGPRDRELIALRYGADLTARQIAHAVGLSTHAVEVALGRAEARLRSLLERQLVHE